ncbi:hypothetical protein Tco_1501466 [Tanacetum coccineum]
MHTTMVPEQVKTLKIQVGVQVSRPEELKRHLQHWKQFERLYYVLFVLVRKIVSNSVRAEEDDDGGILSEKRTVVNGNRTLELVGKCYFFKAEQNPRNNSHGVRSDGSSFKSQGYKGCYNKESGKISREEILTSNKTRDVKWLELTLLDHVTGRDMLKLYRSATGVTFIITTVPVPLNVVTAGRSITK